MGGIDGCILLLNVLLLTRIFTTCRIKYVLSFQSLPLNTELPRNLQQTKFVFIRRDAHKTQKHKFRTGSESTTTVQIMIGSRGSELTTTVQIMIGSRGSGVAETEYEPHNLVVIN